jgi:hypothetical protein
MNPISKENFVTKLTLVVFVLSLMSAATQAEEAQSNTLPSYDCALDAAKIALRTVIDTLQKDDIETKSIALKSLQLRSYFEEGPYQFDYRALVQLSTANIEVKSYKVLVWIFRKREANGSCTAEVEILQ